MAIKDQVNAHSIVAGGGRRTGFAGLRKRGCYRWGLEAAEQRKNEAERGHEQEAQQETAYEDHEEVADPTTDAVVDLDGSVGEHVAHYAAAVERRDGQQVEEEEREIDKDGEAEEESDGMRLAGIGHAQCGRKRHLDCRRAVGDDFRHHYQGRECYRDEDEIGKGAGESSEVVVADNFLEVARDDGGGLGPADEHEWHMEADERAEDDKSRKEQGSDGIDMVHGVEGDAALQAGGLVAEAGGHPGVGALVET